MRLVSLANCVPGVEIAKSIFSETGSVLVGAGISLTQRMIDSLISRNIGMVYIKDKVTADLDMKEDIPIEMRVEASKALQDTFLDVAKFNKTGKAGSVPDLKVEKLQKVFKDMIAELKNSKDAMNLLTNIFAHDNYVFSHSVNVTLYTLAMAVKLDYDDKKLAEIAMGGILHDIGKTMIPVQILNKPGKLTNEEFDIIKKHSEYGFEILRKQHGLSLLAAHCAFQHHEKLDGTGYPRRLKGDEIHPYAKIMAVADVFDALTSHRVYRKAMLPHEAMEIIFAGSNTHFDPHLIQTFQKSVASYPVGVTVKLNTGETALVVEYMFHAPSRPIVRIIKDPHGVEMTKPLDLDLSKNLSIMITECDAIMG